MYLHVGERRFVVEQARFVAYHCAETPDWNVEIVVGGRSHWLVGTMDVPSIKAKISARRGHRYAANA